MKKCFALILLLCLIPLPSLANSWGLRGDLLEAVMTVDTWNDYSTITKQVDNIAVMGSRYHNALMLVDDDVFHVYPTAVYQPGDDRGKQISLSGDNDLFTLAYGDRESYTFMHNGQFHQLLRAVIGDFSITLDSNASCYRASMNDENLIVQHDFPLSRFNISLFPRSLEDVHRLNLMDAALEPGSSLLGSYGQDLSSGIRLEGQGTGNAPVYSAPFGESSWRAAKGKAAVSLKGEMWAHALYTNNEGDSYALIHYDVSERTQRYGFISAGQLSLDLDTLPRLYPLQMPLRAIRATYLTDDPLVSQYRQFEAPEGTLFTCLGLLNDDYAYVSAEVRDGHFADGGEIVWGFVPVKDLELFTSPVSDFASLPLCGRWLYHSGLEALHGALILNEDGTYLCDEEFTVSSQLMSSPSGTWTLCENNPDNALFAHEYSHVIIFTANSGEVFVRGLRFEDQALILGGAQGFGCYMMDTPAYSPEE
ncbi:MAG: hypothetical protein E7331_12645 [Clostridiales bacterium]|nr:hypothetical protein [Clostridiales bacterium]